MQVESALALGTAQLRPLELKFSPIKKRNYIYYNYKNIYMYIRFKKKNVHYLNGVGRIIVFIGGE